ncbi:MAG: hypothetical protein HKN79_05215 [Flavobacteriales bacterium]|nr:hypothetical protein [Flavobacteriales bacterium]
MHVLVFSYYWPPAGGPGVQRWVKMCNHLIESGTRVTVITVRNGSYPAIDHSLEEELHPDIHVIKTRTIEPFGIFNALQGKKGKGSSVGMIGLDSNASLFKRMAIWVRANWLIPDARRFWKNYALNAASKIIGRSDVTHIITTGPPHSTHMIGLELKRKFQLPWIADLRDPWVNIHYHDIFPLTDATRKKHLALETQVLSEADHVTVVSEGMKREFENRAKGISVVFNGYDDADMLTDAIREKDTFTIRYIGNLKPNQEVEAFNRALSQCVREIDGFQQEVRLQLIGNKDPGLLDRLASQDRSELIQSIEPVNHERAVGYMKGAELLLFIIPKASNNKLIITGKLFEYLASRTPILAIGPSDGDAAEILRRAKNIPMYDYTDSTGITEAIRGHYGAWKEALPREGGDAGRIAQFSRKNQTSIVRGILADLQEA